MAERGIVDSILDFAEGAVGSAEAITGSAARADLRVVETKAQPRRFRIVEAIEGDGSTSWIVTNGIESAACSSPELAEKVRRALDG